MRRSGLAVLFTAACLLGALLRAADAGLVHRWSFNETGGAGTTLADSVGGAGATIVNVGVNNADVGTTAPGQVFMMGGNKGFADYVELPDGTISAITNDCTIELWATQLDARNWGRLISFGGSNTDVLLMSWSRGWNVNQDAVRWVDTGVAGNNDNNVNDSMAPYTPGTEFHVAMTIDVNATGTMTRVKWYKDGVYKGEFDTDNKLSDLGDTESALGRSKWGDYTACALFNELRIHDEVLSEAQIAASTAAGPGELPPVTDPVSDVTVNSATLNGTVRSTNGATSAFIYWGTQDGTTLASRSDVLNYAFYDGAAEANLLGIDDGAANGENGGLFSLTPSSSTYWYGEVLQRDISDSYCHMWWGNFTAPTSGTYTFFVHGDDQEVLWIDVNTNGEFEIATDLVSSNAAPENWNTPHTETVDLTGGVTYAWALANYEGGGGDFVEFGITIPDGAQQSIDPSDPGQAGWWSSADPAWEHVEALGVQPVGSISAGVAGLVSDTRYYYRVMTSNAVSQSWWADGTVSFTARAPYLWDGAVDDLWGTAGNWGSDDVPDTAGEPARFKGDGTGDVDLNGENYTLGAMSFEAGDYRVTDGSGTPGSLTAAALTNEAGSNVIDVDMTVAGAAVASGGALTLSSADTFSAGLLEVGDATVTLSKGITFDFNKLNHGYYAGAAGSELAAIDDGIANARNGGLFALAPTTYTEWTGEVWRGGIGNYYCQMWWGNFHAPASGTYTFYVHGDDYEILWVDLNRNGEFEAANGEDISRNLEGEEGWNTPHTETVDLVGGQVYAFALAHREGGGGDFVNFTIALPGQAAVRANPGNAAQAGWWSISTYGAFDMTGTPIAATGDSLLRVLSEDASLGDLRVEDGSDLEIAGNASGDRVSFTAGSITGDLSVATRVDIAGFATAGDSVFTINMDAGLTVDGPISADSVLAYGDLTAPGTIAATNKISIEPPRTVTNVLAGTAAVWLGELRDNNGVVALTETNTYTGDTVIRRALLHAEEGVGLPTNSTLRFASLGDDEYAMLEGAGSFVRNIDTNAGSVVWDARGGFSALGGPLTVTLNGGAMVGWGDTTNGFNNQRLQFNAPSADDALTIVNDIDLGGGDYILYNWDNPATNADVAILSGTIVGSNPNTYLRKFRNGTLWLTSFNMYQQMTWLDDGILRADDGLGLPSNSLLYFEQNNAWAEGVLEAQGAINRDIGLGAGEVSWGIDTARRHGGFAAYGGPLNVTLEGGAQLDWASTNAGFSGQWLQLGSRSANDIVTLNNAITLTTNADVNVIAFDNTGSTNDVAVLSGIISGGNAANLFWKRGPGTLCLTANNTYEHRTMIDSGILRADDTVGIPRDSTVIFDEANATIPCIWETSGAITRDVGPNNEAGAVSWDWQHGGFAAFGGPLTVNLEGGNTLTTAAGADTGFDGHWLQLGSRTATDVVTLENDLLIENDNFQMRLFDNPDRDDDFAVMAGDITQRGNGDMEVRGAGLLKMTGDNNIRQARVYDTAIVLFNGEHVGSDYVFTEANQNGTIGGDGSMQVFNYIDIRNGGTLAPGDSGVGTLTVAVDAIDLEMQAGSTYAWELGGRGHDTVALDGSLRLTAGWQVKLQDAGGVPVASEEYDLFTYAGTMNDYNDPVIDLSEAPAHWITNSVQVAHDTVGKRVYITGLFSTLGIGNRAATALTDVAAQPNGVVSCSNETLHVWAYWGADDGGADAGNWSNEVYVGVFSNAVDRSLDAMAGPLTASTPYYFTFRATNATTDIWASPSMDFVTLGSPVVGNDGTDLVGDGMATLQGRFLDHNRGDVTIYWGATDGGTNAGSWEHTESLGAIAEEDFSQRVSPVYYPNTYHFRCYATNAYGDDWADATASFSVATRPGVRYPVSGLMGRWSFDDDTARDSSGNDYDGENMGGTYSTDVPGVLTGGKSIDLRPGGYMVKVDTGGTQDVFDLDVLSASCWVKGWPIGDNWQPFVAKGGENGQGWQLRRYNNTANQISWTLRGPGNDDWNVTTNINDSGWHHLVATYGDGYRRLYVDNIKLGEEMRAGAITDDPDMLVFGARQQNGSFNDYAGVMLDDILIYDRVLDSNEVDQLFRNAEMSAITVANAQPTDVTTDSAMMNGEVALPDAVYDVWVYWGATDIGTSGVWDSSELVGTYTDYVGDVSHPITGLMAGTTNWYTFRVSNAVDSIWATPSESVTPVIVPVVGNGSGADVAMGAATLNGELTAGNFADVVIYWGYSDGETNAGAWDFAISMSDVAEGTFSSDVSAGYGMTYYYRCYATNATGVDWADATVSFTTDSPTERYRSGLLGTHTNGNMYLGSENNGNLGFVLGPYGGRSGAEHWNDVIPNGNSTLFYDGEIYLANGSVTFVENIDDVTRLEIDGELVLNNNQWNVPTHGTITRNVGWYDIDLRFSHGGGGYGPVAGQGGWDATFGFGMDVQGRDTQEETNFVFPEDPGDATLFRYHDPVLTALTTDGISGRTANSAVVNGTLSATGWVFKVYAMYGTNDAGTVFGDWDHAMDLGYYTNVNGAISATLSGLAGATDYWCAFHATNAVTNLWGTPGQTFQAMSVPTIANSAPTDVTRSRATLNGDLVAGGVADVTVYWGETDGGTSASAWGHTNTFGERLPGAVSLTIPVMPGQTYHYRCYATNSVDSDWADTTESFQTPPPVSIDDWLCSMRITFDGYAGGETLTNFPALVLLSENLPGFQYNQFTSGQGYDLRFTDDSRSRFFNHEIEYWDKNGTSAVWVQVPELSGSNTVIWALWRNKDALVSTLPADCMLDGSTWSEGYEAVWHFANGVTDSTTNNTAAEVGAPGYSTTEAVVGPAIVMNGSADYVDVNDGFADFTSGITVAAWARPTAFGNWARIIDFGNAADVDNIVFARQGTGANVAWDFKDTAGGNEDYRPGGAHYVLNEWRFVAGTCSPGGVNAATARVYVEGAEVGAKTDHTPPPVVTRVNNYIGKSNWNDALYAGQMDELRVSTVERSADWLMAVHKNSGDNANFNTYGAVHAPSGTMLIIR